MNENQNQPSLPDDPVAAVDKAIASNEVYLKLLFRSKNPQSQLERVLRGGGSCLPLGVKMPPNMDLMGWLKRFAKERGIEVEYIDCRTLTDYNRARDFMMALPDHPGTMVLIDRPDCLPESEYRPQIASMLVSSWKNERMDFSSRDGRYVIVRRSDFITFITIGKDGTFPQGWTQNWAIPFMDWEEVGKPL